MIGGLDEKFAGARPQTGRQQLIVQFDRTIQYRSKLHHVVVLGGVGHPQCNGFSARGAQLHFG